LAAGPDACSNASRRMAQYEPIEIRRKFNLDRGLFHSNCDAAECMDPEFGCIKMDRPNHENSVITSSIIICTIVQ
jgi:hypothetical protein